MNDKELNQFVEAIINKVLIKHNLIKSNTGVSISNQDSIDEALRIGNEALQMIEQYEGK